MTGARMVNTMGAEVPPPGAGFETWTLADPCADKLNAETSALRLPLLTNVVGSMLPFHKTFEPGTKFPPVT